jgi:acyl dehydratase
MTLHLEDFCAGQTFTSAAVPLDAAAIKAFATAYDPQPFHLDEEAAQASFFGGLAASGWHTAALTMRLIVESVPIRGGVIGASVEVSWPRPTRPDDTLHAESEVLEVSPSRSKPDRGIVTMRTTTRNQHGETVQVLTSKLVAFRRPA